MLARVTRLWGIAVTVCVAGCGLTDGFRDVGETLFDGEETRFSDEPIQLMQGSFRRATLVAARGVEPHLVAITDEDSPRVLIQGRSDQEPCDAGPGDEFEQLTSPSEESLVVRTVTQPDAEGRRTYRFVDTDCVAVTPPIEDALLLDSSCAQGTCVQIYLQSNGTLVFLDPVAVSRVHEIDDVVDIQHNTYALVLRESGDLLGLSLSDPKGARIVAEAVERFALDSGSSDVAIQTRFSFGVSKPKSSTTPACSRRRRHWLGTRSWSDPVHRVTVS